MHRVSRLLMLAASAALTNAIELDINSTSSLRNATATLAYGLLSWYSNNQSTTAPTLVGTLPQPLYWWEAGAMWGSMVDYWAYTNDTSYNPVVNQAILAQMGPDYNFMPPAYYSSLGNDDQAFWAFAALSALEYGLEPPAENATHDGKSVWLAVAENTFNTLVPRWNATTCNGGLKWQIFPSNPNGFTYKNSVSNGGLFQIAARLARYTGNQTYVDWADKVWDWMYGIELIDNKNWMVWDGTNDAENCTGINQQAWSYTPGMMLYGSAVMYNYTNGSKKWEERTIGILSACKSAFFSPYDNATNILYERTCEPTNSCNNDQFSFKGYMSRWLAKAAIVAPHLQPEVTTLLSRSATAAAQACSGGVNATQCGEKWYVGGYDGSFGVGQQMSALEAVQALLVLNPNLEVASRYPKTGPGVAIQQAPAVTSTLTIPTETGFPPPRGNNDGGTETNAAYRLTPAFSFHGKWPGSGNFGANSYYGYVDWAGACVFVFFVICASNLFSVFDTTTGFLCMNIVCIALLYAAVAAAFAGA